MYCHSCGTQLSNDANFCTDCGAKISENNQSFSTATPSNSMDESVINIPVKGTGNIIFDKFGVEHNGKKFMYSDIDGVSFYAKNTSINLIPVSQMYYVKITSGSEKISFNFGSSLYIGNKAKKDTYTQIIVAIHSKIFPLVLKKLVDNIFERGLPVIIGGVTFSNNGCSTKGILSQTFVGWPQIAETNFRNGSVILHKIENNKVKSLASVSMSVLNAVVIPDLIVICKRVLGV